jgi:N-acetylglucosamine-6-phosphate deacetylase
MEIGYSAQKIFTGKEWLYDQVILTEHGTVKQILAKNDLSENISLRPLNGAIVAPAFIDAQIYGAHGKLLAAYPTIEALEDLYDYCTAGGATLFVPTVATNSLEVFHECIDAVRMYWEKGGKGVAGLHLEGPWISEAKRGAHLTKFIHPPTLEEVRSLLEYGAGVIKMITLAPEECSEEVLALLLTKDVVLSAGHSDATYQQAIGAFNKGIPTATHLFNAMSALQHREPGTVGALLDHSSVRCSVIPDGYHVDYAAIRIAKKIMGTRLFAITDAVTETTEGAYPHHLEGDRYTAGGTLSGSALTMHKAFYNLVTKVGIEVEEALRMCSTYPAEVLQVDAQYGKIAPGYKAQFVVLDEDLNLLQTII